MNVVLCFIAAIQANDLKNEENPLNAIDSKWHVSDTRECVHPVAIAVPCNYICIILTRLANRTSVIRII